VVQDAALRPGAGVVADEDRRPIAVVTRLSEEHAVLTASGPTGLAIGERLAIIPAHACTTVNLYPAFLLLRSGSAVRRLPVDARGWQQIG
jgi:D-serine deaminase-like pyridoxal phosphate-dependent protein